MPVLGTCAIHRNALEQWAKYYLLMLLDVILEVLAECAESSGQTKVEAQSLLQQATSVRNDDLRHIWNDILDRQLTELDNRFQEDQFGIMRAAATFLPQSKTFAQKESLRTLCDNDHISVEDAELINDIL